MTPGERTSLLRVAIAAVRDCADRMESQAVGLLEKLPAVPMEPAMRESALELSSGLKDASGRVMFELALLQAERAGESAGSDTAVKRLSAMDAAMMGAVAALADVVDPLEKSAESDERYEPAFVLVIEAVGVMLQAIEKAKSATQAVCDRAEAPWR